MSEDTIEAYSYLRQRSKAENEVALAYFNSRILAAKKKRTGSAWLPEALPMMEQGAATAKQILDNFKKQNNENNNSHN